LEAREALKVSVLICCQSWEEIGGMKSDRLIGLKLWLWNRRLRKMDWDAEGRAFAAYRKAGALEFPLSDVLRHRSGPAARPPGSPFLLRLHQFLVVRLGLSQVAAWDYPLGLAKMQWASHWEEEGGLELYNHEDAEHDAFVAKCEAEDAAGAERGALSAERGALEMPEGSASSQGEEVPTGTEARSPSPRPSPPGEGESKGGARA
jgi:hypothetical protein